MAYYNEVVARETALALDETSNQDEITNKVYEAVKNEGILVSEDDVANSVKLLLTFNLYRG